MLCLSLTLPMLCLSLTHPMLRLPVRRIDDPLLWGGQRGLRIRDPKLCRWTLTASEICFTGLLDSYIFRIGKSIPITRNQGVFQPGMDEALLRLQQGDWLNIFPEARIIQQHGPLPRLKWGLASLLDRLCPSLPPPILLCVGHSGLERAGWGRACWSARHLTLQSAGPPVPLAAPVHPPLRGTQRHQVGGCAMGKGEKGGFVHTPRDSNLLDRLCPSLPLSILLSVGHSGIKWILPQSYRNTKRPLIPLWNQRVSVVVGEPFSFDLPSFVHPTWPLPLINAADPPAELPQQQAAVDSAVEPACERGGGRALLL
ncbi:unnamed protein product [Closterium sp. NIES-65]|nr:unnamed protein product [Closterium sp. NIES-65]